MKVHSSINNRLRDIALRQPIVNYSLLIEIVMFIRNNIHSLWGGTALLLWLRGNSAWGASAFLTLREFCVSAPLTVPATVLYRAVYRRAHRDD